MLRIESVEAVQGYKLKVKLNNGSSLLLNMENKLNAIRFRQLIDKELFGNVNTDGSIIHWNDLIEISITEIFEIAQSPGPMA